MVTKRKLSTRHRNGVTSKSRKSTPIEESHHSQSVKDTLPTKLEEGQPLPTLTESDLRALSSNDFQSIAERPVMSCQPSLWDQLADSQTTAES